MGKLLRTVAAGAAVVGGLVLGVAMQAEATCNPGDPPHSDPCPPPVTVTTPEPASLMLMGSGLLGAYGMSRRRRKAPKA